MRSSTLRIATGLLSVATFLGLLSLSATPSHAQSALCPGSIAGQTGFALSNGTCTNGFTGAFSGAALATQSLSDLSQSATQETVRNTTSAIATRRVEELQRCPDGFSRVNGACERIKPVAAPATSRPVATSGAPARLPAKPVARARVPRRPVVSRPAPVPVETMAPPPVLAPAPIYQSRFGAWAQGFGSTEDRSAIGQTSINCCTGPTSAVGGIPIGLEVSEKSHADTYGFLGGIDYTARSLGRADDGLILGLLVGYLETDCRLKTATTASLVPNVENGSGTVNATLSGASTGIYATYFSGPFTADLAFKADIFDLNESFTDQLAFTQNKNATGLVTTGVQPFSGSGSGGLTNLSTFSNLSYRLGTLGPMWIEPVVGFQYTASLYDNRAKRELGLDDGDLLMVQGGARVGTDTILANQRKLSTSLTGLAYSDVSVSGGFIEGGFFGTNLLAKSDEGEVRGRGVLAVNYDLGTGVSLYAQGDVYGGDRLFGAGGKGGLRVQW